MDWPKIVGKWGVGDMDVRVTQFLNDEKGDHLILFFLKEEEICSYL